MPDLSWRNAIIKVLENADEPMHYTDIAEEIAERGLRTKLRATPANSVGSRISTSLRDEGGDSPFVRVSMGYYSLRTTQEAPPPDEQPDDETGLLNAFGMYWSRDKVHWSGTSPRILGQQQAGSDDVDFSSQIGVYLLHDGRHVVYVGRTTEQRLGARLKYHTVDRLSSRWDRFSWFGVLSVEETGDLSEAPSESFNIDTLIATMEALLIEGLEPPQNRKRGDDFRAVEFLQLEDQEIQTARKAAVLAELAKAIGSSGS